MHPGPFACDALTERTIQPHILAIEPSNLMVIPNGIKAPIRHLRQGPDRLSCGGVRSSSGPCYMRAQRLLGETR